MADLKDIGDDSREITYEEFCAAQKSARKLEGTITSPKAGGADVGATLDASVIGLPSPGRLLKGGNKINVIKQ